MGGPGYDVFEPNTNYVKVYTPKAEFGQAEWRRMVYQDKPRHATGRDLWRVRLPRLQPGGAQAQRLDHRPASAQPVERPVRRASRPDCFAAAAASARPATIRPRRSKRAFWLAFGRAPDDDELAAAVTLVAQQGLPVFCRAMLNANEFLYLN